LNGRANNNNQALGTGVELQLKFLGGFENPITINGAQRTLFNDVVSGVNGDMHIWIFYGDQQNEAVFPVSGGVTSSASAISMSMMLVVVLSVIVMCLF